MENVLTYVLLRAERNIARLKKYERVDLFR